MDRITEIKHKILVYKEQLQIGFEISNELLDDLDQLRPLLKSELDELKIELADILLEFGICKNEYAVPCYTIHTDDEYYDKIQDLFNKIKDLQNDK